MKYKSKYLIQSGERALKASDIAKMANKMREENEKNDFWKWAWIPIFIAFTLVVIMLLPK